MRNDQNVQVGGHDVRIYEKQKEGFLILGANGIVRPRAPVVHPGYASVGDPVVVRLGRLVRVAPATYAYGARPIRRQRLCVGWHGTGVAKYCFQMRPHAQEEQYPAHIGVHGGNIAVYRDEDQDGDDECRASPHSRNEEQTSRVPRTAPTRRLFVRSTPLGGFAAHYMLLLHVGVRVLRTASLLAAC
jgi:hypothetical protein